MEKLRASLKKRLSLLANEVEILEMSLDEEMSPAGLLCWKYLIKMVQENANALEETLTLQGERIELQ